MKSLGVMIGGEIKMDKEECKHEWRFYMKDGSTDFNFYYCIFCLSKAIDTRKGIIINKAVMNKK